jgi:hypothetical protein
MEGTYQQQIVANLDELRKRLWSLCSLSHADLALTASREALGAVRSMEAMTGGESGRVAPGDLLIAPEPLPRKQRRSPQRRGR